MIFARCFGMSLFLAQGKHVPQPSFFFFSSMYYLKKQNYSEQEYSEIWLKVESFVSYRHD